MQRKKLLTRINPDKGATATDKQPLRSEIYEPEEIPGGRLELQVCVAFRN